MQGMPFMLRKITIPLILASFLMAAFFGFVAMSYGPDGRMQGDCPFSNMGMSLCPQSALPSALHHISAYHSFLNVPISFQITSLIITLLIIVSGVLVFSFNPPLYRSLTFVSYNSTPFTSHNRKIKRWLSLLEHSPSR